MITKDKPIKIDFFKEVVSIMAEKIKRNEDYLTKLDSDIGDGDHGVNMNIGFSSVSKNINQTSKNSKDIGDFLKKVGFTLLDKIGGASGPLYGSLFMTMGSTVKGKNEIFFQDYIQMLERGLETLEKRGKAKVGDKTMIDVLGPYVKFLLKNRNKDGLGKILDTGKKLSKEKVEDTKGLFPKKGRAARLGKKAVGFVDPGGASINFLLDSFYDVFKKIE